MKTFAVQIIGASAMALSIGSTSAFVAPQSQSLTSMKPLSPSRNAFDATEVTPRSNRLGSTDMRKSQ